MKFFLSFIFFFRIRRRGYRYEITVTFTKNFLRKFIYNYTITFDLSGQPQIDPYYFWSFLTIINGRIPGHLPFKVNGHVEVVDGGLYFDGTSAFLSTRLVSSDILASPDRARQGLAFGIKLKFDGAVKQYDTPRYVLDTGAKSGGKTGVSLYVLNGKLIAEIATTSMKWKVRDCCFNLSNFILRSSSVLLICSSKRLSKDHLLLIQCCCRRNLN